MCEIIQYIYKSKFQVKKILSKITCHRLATSVTKSPKTQEKVIIKIQCQEPKSILCEEIDGIA